MHALMSTPRKSAMPPTAPPRARASVGLARRLSGQMGRPLWPGRWASALLALSCALTGAITISPAQAAQLAVGASLNTVPTALVDSLGTLSLSPSQFLVPVLAQSADDLAEWQFDLRFDADVATPVDVGGLYFSTYQADFGIGAISQITGSGFLLDGRLDDVSGYFDPSVSGDGVIAYVLFQYLAGHDGQDPGVQVDDPAPQALPEPSTLGLVCAAALLGTWQARRRIRARPLSHIAHESCQP